MFSFLVDVLESLFRENVNLFNEKKINKNEMNFNYNKKKEE